MNKNQSNWGQLQSLNQSLSSFNSDENENEIVDLPISELVSFKNHPFMVNDDEEMEILIESIIERGIDSPITVRPSLDGYEIISGHRRTHACRRLGLTTVPALIKDLSDKEATDIMVDSNLLARSKIRPSERAFAYKMKLDILTQSRKDGELKTEKRTDEILSESVGTTRANIHFYIRLTYLIPELLKACDDELLSLTAAQPLSNLPEEYQQTVYKLWEQYSRPKFNVTLLKDMYNLYKDNQKLTENDILVGLGILTQIKQKPVSVKFNQKYLSQYFDDSYSQEQIEDIISNLLNEWKEKQNSNSLN